MARIQILPLPVQVIGGVTSAPFMLIIDQADDRTEDGSPVWTPAVVDMLTVELNPLSVLVLDSTLDVGGVDEEVQRAAQLAVERLMFPGQSVRTRG